MRYNYNCQVRNSSCHVFERVRQPPPIPDDLYVKTGFDNDLDWVIISQQNTGKLSINFFKKLTKFTHMFARGT